MKQLIYRLRAIWLKFVYRNKPYSEYYAKLMNERAEVDPMKAVGGRWDEIGPLQLDFLKLKGLAPNSSLLDYGCGSLRGGIHFIKYLEPKKYLGVDISSNLIDFAKSFIEEQALSSKHPELILSHDLTLAYLEKRNFNFIIATSVLTHMVWEDIATLLSNIHKIMSRESVFYATYLEREGGRTTTNDFQNFYYSYEQFKAVCEPINMLVVIEDDFVHPRGQKMLGFRIK